MQNRIYQNAIKAFKVARESRNRDCARNALQRAKIARAMIELGHA